MLNGETNEVFMIDFGLSKFIPDGKVKLDHPMHGMCHHLFFGIERFSKEEYSFSADVF